MRSALQVWRSRMLSSVSFTQWLTKLVLHFADYGAHIIHGAANAMYLPKVIAFNAKDETAKKRYGVIVDYMGIAPKEASDDDKVAALIAISAQDER